MAEWDAYERISDDPTDTQAGLGRQHDDNNSAVAKRGGRVVQHHPENNTSAYKKKRVRVTDQYGNTYDAWRVMRPVWAAALQRLRTGEAKRLMVYDLDRLARDPRDLEDAIEAVEHYGAEIRSATASDIDLSTQTGVMNARMLVIMANKASADTARRVKRQKEERLATGLPPGSRYRTFGYTHQNIKKGILGWEVIEEEAAIVRDVFTRVAKGESVNSITNDLRDKGVLTVSGKPWSFQATSRMLESPIYAGFVSHKGSVVGASTVPKIIDEALYQSAQGRASRPAWNARKHLLSGILVCDACKAPMVGAGQRYICSRMQGGCGNVAVKTKWIDDVVNAYMGAMVKIESDKQGTPEPTVEVDPTKAIDEQIANAQAANVSGDLALADLLPILKGLRAQRVEVVKQAAKDVEENSVWQAIVEYDNADLSVKRTEIRKWIAAIMVKPALKGRNTFDERRFYVLVSEAHPVLQYTDNRLVGLQAINVEDMRRHIEGYDVQYPIDKRL